MTVAMQQPIDERFLNRRTQLLEEKTAELLAEMGSLFDQFVYFPSPQARDGVLLWILHTYVFDTFRSTPRLSIRSEEPGSGKSLVLELVGCLSANPRSVLNAEVAVIFRIIDAERPTLMLDEADTLWGTGGSSSAKQGLRGVLNAGHKQLGEVPRCGAGNSVIYYKVFCPVVMAGIGRLPETLAQRSVEIVMRKPPEGVPKLRPFREQYVSDELSALQKKCAEWADVAEKPLESARPELPVEGRDADVWESLIAIADLAGDEWAVRARQAAVVLTAEAAHKPRGVATDAVRYSPRMLAVKAFVEANPDGVNASMAANALDMKRDDAGKYLRRLEEDGEITRPADRPKGWFIPKIMSAEPVGDEDEVMRLYVGPGREVHIEEDVVGVIDDTVKNDECNADATASTDTDTDTDTAMTATTTPPPTRKRIPVRHRPLKARRVS